MPRLRSTPISRNRGSRPPIRSTTRVVSVLLSLCLSLPAAAAAPDKDAAAFVEKFLKIPTADLPIDQIERFLGIKPEELPARLRKPYKAKKLELFTMKHIAEKSKSGSVRMPADDCSAPVEVREKDAGILKKAGFEEIWDVEVNYLMSRTKCTMRDLMCEFTLHVVIVMGHGKKAADKRYFLHPKDPLFALVAEYRASGREKQTRFFGLGGFTCAH